MLILLQELHLELESALKEVDNLKESRERQKEMVQAIVNQRDMYRTLLAQATPLPGDTTASLSRSYSEGRGLEGAGPVEDRREPAGAEEEMRKELEETREQFEAYKKEKEKNNAMLLQQLDKLRDESSELKIQNAKLGSKV